MLPQLLLNALTEHNKVKDLKNEWGLSILPQLVC